MEDRIEGVYNTSKYIIMFGCPSKRQYSMATMPGTFDLRTSHEPQLPEVPPICRSDVSANSTSDFRDLKRLRPEERVVVSQPSSSEEPRAEVMIQSLRPSCTGSLLY